MKPSKNRRVSVRVLGILVSISLVPVSWFGSSDTASGSELNANKRPNILIIVTDDQPLGTL
ncbi:MAG: hypothetical protein ACRD1T_16105, partial [Acidimicrobiia bacterium]